MMKLSSFHLINPKLHLPNLPKTLKPPLPKLPSPSPSLSFKHSIKTAQEVSELVVVVKKIKKKNNNNNKWEVIASSLGLVLLIVGMFEGAAMALGPEGPIVEEFWDNMRRYALYILTVSSGAIYTILVPIVELLKNPLTALILLLLLVGSFYLVSLVLGAMTGVSDFSYQYSY